MAEIGVVEYQREKMRGAKGKKLELIKKRVVIILKKKEERKGGGKKGKRN